MSKSLIYLIAIFVLWMYFSFSGTAGAAEKPTIKNFDNAGSGHGGTMVSNKGNAVSGDFQINPAINTVSKGESSSTGVTPGGGFGTSGKLPASYADFEI